MSLRQFVLSIVGLTPTNLVLNIISTTLLFQWRYYFHGFIHVKHVFVLCSLCFVLVVMTVKIQLVF